MGGRPKVNRFEKRFGNRIDVEYEKKPGSLVEQKRLSEELTRAIRQVMTDLLKREPTEAELLGIEPISAR